MDLLQGQEGQKFCTHVMLLGFMNSCCTQKVPISGGLIHLPYLLSISVSMAVIKDLSTNYIKALELNQAYMLLKLRR